MPDDANPKDLIGATKPPLNLVPSALSLHVSQVMALGAKKYGAFNWRQKKVKHSIYLAAALRHLAQALDGEKIDPESGQPHEAHAASCMAIILDARANGTLIEDITIPGPATKIIAEMTVQKEPTHPSAPEEPLTYFSTQATNCAVCGKYKHTPLRVDHMGGYVCLTCIDKKLESTHH